VLNWRKKLKENLIEKLLEISTNIDFFERRLKIKNLESFKTFQV
jgi:hypothetical protein